MINFIFSLIMLIVVAADIVRRNRGFAVARFTTNFVFVSIAFLLVAPKSVGPNSAFGMIVGTIDLIILMPGILVVTVIYLWKYQGQVEADDSILAKPWKKHSQPDVNYSILSKPVQLHSGARTADTHGSKG